jgi:hypothetical protein
MKALTLATLVALFTVGPLAAPSSQQPSPATDRVSSLRITLLSTMLAIGFVSLACQRVPRLQPGRLE